MAWSPVTSSPGSTPGRCNHTAPRGAHHMISTHRDRWATGHPRRATMPAGTVDRRRAHTDGGNDMATARRTGGENSKTRTDLLNAAQDLMLDEGYAAVSSRRVAHRLGFNA